MKKVILTEDQMKLVYLIKETTQYTDRLMEQIKDLKSRTNKLYNVVTFTTVAEMSDKDGNINIMKQTHDKLYSEHNTLDKNITAIEQNPNNRNQDDDWINPQIEEIWTNLDTRSWSLGVKINALGEIIDFLVSASEPNLHKPFNDITPTKI